MKLLPNVGERIVVYGMMYAQVVVESVLWDEEKYDWKVCLDWGEFGKSRVWVQDENTVWFRWKDSN